jgi:predicted metal-dependent phosphoesterase TrpH
MLKVELHAHTDQDPADHIAHTTEALIDHAARLGYHALAVTLHDRYFDPEPWAAYARPRGIVLISGIERTIAGRHLLLINFPPSIASVRTFEALEAAKAASDSALVIAPHPFYPTRTGLGPLLDRLGSLVDAIEVNAMYTKRLDFNRRAVTWARTNGKPTVGNTDLHLLEQMGTTYSMVDATPEPAAICQAIRAGRVTVTTTPLSEFRAASIFSRMLWGGARGRLRSARARRRRG